MLDQSLNDQISVLQSNLDTLQAEKQSTEEDLQQQIMLLKVCKIDYTLKGDNLSQNTFCKR